MARRRKSGGDSLFIQLIALAAELPWWGGPLLAGLAYLILAVGVPWFFQTVASGTEVQTLPYEVFSRLAVKSAPFVSLLVLAAGAFGIVRRLRDGEMLDAQTGVASVRSLSWQEFERLLAEAFRREGYRVEHTGGNGPDGGVDLRLYRDGLTDLVQCKHWKEKKVGVKTVRELRGVMAAEGAPRGTVVTSGEFTGDAETFARSNGIRLIGGADLLRVIHAVQREPHVAAPAPEARVSGVAPACPKCGGAMVLRTARQGSNAGRPFWGCSSYPRCRGILNCE